MLHSDCQMDAKIGLCDTKYLRLIVHDLTLLFASIKEPNIELPDFLVLVGLPHIDAKKQKVSHSIVCRCRLTSQDWIKVVYRSDVRIKIDQDRAEESPPTKDLPLS